MNKFPITLCLYTSTKGHFDRKDIYQKTILNWLSQLPKNNWIKLKANIKKDTEQEDCSEIINWLELQGFDVQVRTRQWKHGQNSHQFGYLEDMFSMIENTKSEYFLHLEDDMLVNCYKNDLEYWLSKSIEILSKEPNIVQIRIPRFNNEFERINLLKNKHGINAIALKSENNDLFYHNDWSNNPYIARTRDLNAALRILFTSDIPKHSEHGLGISMKYLSSNPTPLVCLNPNYIRCLHIGTPEGQEDKADIPLIA